MRHTGRSRHLTLSLREPPRNSLTPSASALCGGYLGAGAEVGLSELAYVFAEYRRHRALGTHGGDFQGLGCFDMTANQMSFGVNLRF